MVVYPVPFPVEPYDSFESQLVASNFAFATLVVRLAVVGAPFFETFPVPTAVALTGLTGSTPEYSSATA